jgi:hypothetical protein
MCIIFTKNLDKGELDLNLRENENKGAALQKQPPLLHHLIAITVL